MMDGWVDGWVEWWVGGLMGERLRVGWKGG